MPVPIVNVTLGNDVTVLQLTYHQRIISNFFFAFFDWGLHTVMKMWSMNGTQNVGQGLKTFAPETEFVI